MKAASLALVLGDFLYDLGKSVPYELGHRSCGSLLDETMDETVDDDRSIFVIGFYSA